jgi:hypothetical protein
MTYLVDTSVLARLANTADLLHAISTHAVTELHQSGELLHITAQNLIEFRNLATRPKTVNGLGLSIAEAEQSQPCLKRHFRSWPRRRTSIRHGRLSCKRSA